MFDTKIAAPDCARLHACVRGAVQGVGFRPFVFRLATELGLVGWVNNSSQGIFLEVEGTIPAIEQFLSRLKTDKPALSSIQSLETSWLDPVGFKNFQITSSQVSGIKSAIVLPDIATCPDCLREIFDPGNRRYLYPFTNCTHCGPRFSIIESLPYDRAGTSMKRFTMCPECEAEYNDPADRRFHAQPNACAKCGPAVELWNGLGEALFGGTNALWAAARALRSGKIVAVKGIGGFHLMVAAGNTLAVRRLRSLKFREEKPLAVMFGSVDAIKRICQVSPPEVRLLCSPEAPIVLLRRRRKLPPDAEPHYAVCSEVAPENPNLGVLLPNTPLHHLLLDLTRLPLVATSGNLSDEPICTDEQEVLQRLGGIADLFLVHNRGIVRHVDDSIGRVILGREQILRRARGYAPLPIRTMGARTSPSRAGRGVTGVIANPPTTLAVGAQLKNAVALSAGDQIFVSQHIGDLETEKAYDAFRRASADLQSLYEASPTIIAADTHPDYLSGAFAAELSDKPGCRLITVQHHVAHVLSCMAENQLEAPVLGVSWDGAGYGPDQTVWGGEFFHITEEHSERVAHLRPFQLPGGEKATREPRRSALSLLFEMYGDAAFRMKHLAPLRGIAGTELHTLKTMLQRNVHSPMTSSMGRLFDGVSALLGLRQQSRFEGQAAMALEFAVNDFRTDAAYDFQIAGLHYGNATSGAQTGHQQGEKALRFVLDWSPLIEGILADLQRKVSISEIAAKFHNALAESIVFVAKWMQLERVALSGGCFQNRVLTERTVTLLRENGFRPYWHQRVPPNDGGIALGQITAVHRELRNSGRQACV